MQHLGLFEGIGGFSLAARWAGWQTPVMVEWSPYCQAVLKKNFPDATIFGDIKQFDGRPYAGQIDVITGGFPCQPFSHAGKRAGTDDDRYLWPEMLRVIQEVKPAWVVGENVAGLLTMDGGRVFAGILADLENAGYRTEIFVIPALSVGAPHLRNRVWVVANSYGHLHSGKITRGQRQASGISETNRAKHSTTRMPCGANSRDASDAERITSGERYRVEMFRGWSSETEQIGMGNSNTPDANKPGLEKRKGQRGNNGAEQPPTIGNFWREHWHEVATRICRMDDGFPAGVDGIGNIPIKTQKGKAHRLEALGNAIVPQIAFQIFDAINKF